MIVRTLSKLECTKLVTENRLARLACANDGQPYVVPIYYAYAGNHLYGFSMLGKKIEWMRSNPLVSVLIDVRGKGREWQSVIVDGRYEELPDQVGHKLERDHAWTLLSKHVNWWEPGALKPVAAPTTSHSSHVFFRILIDQISGRAAEAKSL
ncbi:MAG: pyridoxamine 5'-phosphate oxidase family protein [Mesorhizobium sp.]|uniref:pyridoxamine 5'-phosphate oxidase family protein n=1 Tax=unclassified Mesorhizobium TaxID=325217 RepID=UPI000FCC1A39|nr:MULTISPECIES: pyridoxamine 5'-phosphate oxidase family protein [unclassified Mesorhizobium]RUV73247.1 pyridoxamine 5'-phosphate oxidase family protein [Mesorhizobium sp. M5C.F.Cr.IN.023.01.1.1]RWF86672.1 MAG: pyridoxamine 5'-phosphate oxidase family protein [Mesorhizobium sp.]RWF95367.1 MAG: pyridoxamine 5'-phosphate oxidase family protein [Mesorhizobium sp.]RWI39793.1 MAG: pyridoxamine 5'-phosphate oxidase family protein [Mesorhizobium sp.]RWI45341.1 MAG: pyridoxamine 5'-phosphate oxidase 